MINESKTLTMNEKQKVNQNDQTYLSWEVERENSQQHLEEADRNRTTK